MQQVHFASTVILAVHWTIVIVLSLPVISRRRPGRYARWQKELTAATA